MSYNGSGTFVVNSSGQPVVTGTVISSTAFNALTADLATGLSTCVTKDGQTATTVRVPFAFGISSTLTTDATSATTGSIITAGGISTQKALWVGTTSRHVGAATFDSTIASGAITSTGAVTGTLFTATATGNNGLGLAASGKPAIYAAGTSEIMRFDFADTTTYMAGIGGAPVKIGTNIATFQVYGASSGGGFRFGRDNTKEGLIYHDGTNILFQSYTPSLGTFLTITGSTGAATFVSSVTATSYITSSDYRLKENVQPMIGSLDKISALKPVTYDWISDGSSAGGFIAHELQAVMPNAVVGEKDAVDDKGEIKPQGIDFGKVFPHLVAAIQELTTRLAALESK